MRRVGCDDWARIVATLAQLADQWQLAEERYVERLRQPRAAAMREDLVAMVTLAAQVIAHVLDDTEHGHVHFLEHRDAALDVEQRYFLWRRHDHAAVERDALRDSQLRVAG